MAVAVAGMLPLAVSLPVRVAVSLPDWLAVAVAVAVAGMLPLARTRAGIEVRLFASPSVDKTERPTCHGSPVRPSLPRGLGPKERNGNVNLKLARAGSTVTVGVTRCHWRVGPGLSVSLTGAGQAVHVGSRNRGTVPQPRHHHHQIHFLVFISRLSTTT